MDLKAIFIQLVRLISRSMSRSGNAAPPKKQYIANPSRKTHEAEKQEKERIRQIVTQWQTPHEQAPGKPVKKKPRPAYIIKRKKIRPKKRIFL